MVTLSRKRIDLFSILLTTLLLLVIASVVWQLIAIQLRLSRNGKTANQLVASLEARFPRSEFRGAASYGREVIYITVLNRIDESERREIEGWLREQRLEQKFTPRIWLRIAQDKEDNVIIIQ